MMAPAAGDVRAPAFDGGRRAASGSPGGGRCGLRLGVDCGPYLWVPAEHGVGNAGP